MAIVKNARVSRLCANSSSGHGKDSMFSDDEDDELQTRISKTDGDDDDDVDSGMDSDGLDLSELGELGEEFFQTGNRKCSIPVDLFDLPDLCNILSLDVWNNCLTEDERFCLTEFLPDMDQNTFNQTLKDLFSGQNFSFGSPLAEVFHRLKSGLYEPRVALYWEGLKFFQRRRHYHLLRSYQNVMVGNFMQIRAAWQNCADYSVEERLRVLNIVKNQRSLTNGEVALSGSETESSSREENVDGLWSDGVVVESCNFEMTRNHQVVQKVRSSAHAMRHHTAGKVLEPMMYGKQKPRGVLKVMGKKVANSKENAFKDANHYPSGNHGLFREIKPCVQQFAVPWEDQVAGYSSIIREGWQMMSDDDGEQGASDYCNLTGNNHVSKVDKVARGNLLNRVKMQKLWSESDQSFQSYMGSPVSASKEKLHFYGEEKDHMQTLDGKTVAWKMGKGRPAHEFSFLDDSKKTKITSKEQVQVLALRGTCIDQSSAVKPSRQSRAHNEALVMDYLVEGSNVKRKKNKKSREIHFSDNKVSAGVGDVSCKNFSPQTASYLHSDRRAVTSKVKLRRKYAQKSATDMNETNLYMRSDETQSDSSKQHDEDEVEPSYMSGLFEDDQLTSVNVRSGDDPEEVKKFVWKGGKHDQFVDAKGNSMKIVYHGKQCHRPEMEISSSKRKEKRKKRDEIMRRKKSPVPPELVDECKQTQEPVKNEDVEGVSVAKPLLKLKMTHSSERMQRGKVDMLCSVSQSNSNHEYENSGMVEALHIEHKPMAELASTRKSGKQSKIAEVQTSQAEQILVDCKSGVKQKKKGKINSTSLDGKEESHQTVHNPIVAKKRGKRRKAEAETVVFSDVIISERNVDAELETKLLKKPFTLITPSVHSGFSFSIVHFLSAVRTAMVSKSFEESDCRNGGNEEDIMPLNRVSLAGNIDLNSSEQTELKNLPSLNVQEIVNRVRSNPGDPCILETEEPLQDLVRGVLKIFSSKTAPLGAKGWKALVYYEKSTKSWSWIGPVSPRASEFDPLEEETSPDAWGVPHKMLVKLVDAFANWLKSGQETLKQIGSLPAPPVSLLLPNLDEKERFKDVRAQKSHTTFKQSCQEVREYFRREEVLRYSVPDRAFSYTTADGRKSIVAPLRRCGGKPTSKAREHFMLKPDRPPHVTILCLVRDAAARLPGSIGTRADVCTLLRDSQYIVEDISDAQLNQVVSGALDRLHYERDPCVLYDGDRKLWVYLHKDREEEDFEDDGTSSTKKWKRPRKDGGTEHSDLGPVTNIGGQGATDNVTAAIYNSDLNVEPSSNFTGEKIDLVYNELKIDIEENMDLFIDTVQNNMGDGHPMGWEVLDLNRSRESKMLCLENSTNEYVDDEAFNQDKAGVAG